MKKIILVLVLCLSVVGISACGASAPKEVKLSPQTTKILEVGKDIAPGTYVVEVDKDYLKGKGYDWNQYFICSNNDNTLDVIKQREQQMTSSWHISKQAVGPDIKTTYAPNGSTIQLDKGNTITIYSVGNMTLKQQ